MQNYLTIQDVVGVEIGLMLIQDWLEIGGPVSNLVISIKLATSQENLKVKQFTEGTNFWVSTSIQYLKHWVLYYKDCLPDNNVNIKAGNSFYFEAPCQPQR